MSIRERAVIEWRGWDMDVLCGYAMTVPTGLVSPIIVVGVPSTCYQYY